MLFGLLKVCENFCFDEKINNFVPSTKNSLILKMMKKTKLTFLLATLMVVATANAQFSWGIQGGVNMSNIHHDNDVRLISSKFGFNVGVLTDFSFTPNTGIRSGLFFTTKGFGEDAHLTCGGTGGTIRYITNSMYLQIPVHFAYKIDVTSGTRIVLHAGPYIAYGVGGTIREGDNRLDWEVFGSRADLRPFDFGLGLGVGFEFGRILTGIGWDIGLVNISNFPNNESVRNKNAFLTVGFRL